jgi:hypothetical protein
MIATGAGGRAHNHCNWAHAHCNGIAIEPGGRTLIATDGGGRIGHVKTALRRLQSVDRMTDIVTTSAA